ncbi:hypothetical protein INR49_000087 [Caranx melampygus]|nr:hypothetical protein INR49_000087 [Caranx melampygus]
MRRCLTGGIRSLSLCSAVVHRCRSADLLPPFKVNGHFASHRKAGFSLFLSRFLFALHGDDSSKDRSGDVKAVSAEAGTMSTPTNPEVKELNPVDFIQLQQYIEYCSLKVKDVLREFDADGRLARHRHGEVREDDILLLFNIITT